MKFLLKPHQYSKTMQYVEVTKDWWDTLLANPPVITEKDRCPLAIFGTPVSDPELDPESGLMRCTGANVDSIYALALDYDNGMSIRQFIDDYNGIRFSLYTSYSYGIKAGDRFRVIVPLKKPFPCELLTCRRVKENLMFHWGNVDPCCVDRGHFQILCARNPNGNYVYHKNPGELWDFDLDGYRGWKAEEDREREERMKAAMENMDGETQERIRNWLVKQLDDLEVGTGTRYNRVKSLLAWAMNNGLGDAVFSVDCPWTDTKWQRRWPSLIEWAATLC